MIIMNYTFNDIRSAMRFVNNSDQDLIIRKNNIFNTKGELIGKISLDKPKKEFHNYRKILRDDNYLLNSESD